MYCETKFVALLGAHWWRRQLQGQCNVVAVSPGLIPTTGLSRGTSLGLATNHPDAKTIPEGKLSPRMHHYAMSCTDYLNLGAANILRALERTDFPEDPEQIFLTSWGEWWPKDVYGNSLDKSLQDKWCPSKEQLEKDEGLTS